jgi:hypothetical protein
MGMLGDDRRFVPQGGVKPTQLRQGPVPQLGRTDPVGPRPVAQATPAPQPSPELSGDEEVHMIEVVGELPDGRQYVAPFDAVFPKGARILGMRERRS